MAAAQESGAVWSADGSIPAAQKVMSWLDLPLIAPLLFQVTIYRRRLQH